MCEIFGISSEKKVKANVLLKEFFGHADEHPDGWGMATFYENSVSVEKEPISALDSVYLKNRMTEEISESILLAHIRKASVGNLQYKNSHPFFMRDQRKRLWTLIHNGTIFESEELEKYVEKQKGSTDSERILCYLIDRINEKQVEAELSEEERFSVLEEAICTITPKNKVNLLVYDGSLLYVHANHKGSLHFCSKEREIIFSTRPLNEERWAEVPVNTLFAYRDGMLCYTGKAHEHEYIKPEEETLKKEENKGFLSL